MFLPYTTYSQYAYTRSLFVNVGACPAPGVTSGLVSFPKPKPANARAPTHSGKTVDILHLSEYVSF